MSVYGVTEVPNHYPRQQCGIDGSEDPECSEDYDKRSSILTGEELREVGEGNRERAANSGGGGGGRRGGGGGGGGGREGGGGEGGGGG